MHAYLCLLLSAGTHFHPSAYSIDLVMAVNGSIANGGCPTSCVGTDLETMIHTCNCPVYARLHANETTGVFLDGIVPTIDVTERNNTQFIWAAPLFTLRGNGSTARLYFQFETSLILKGLEVMLFYCLTWGIGAERIIVYNSEGTFPNLNLMTSIGSFDLLSEPEECGTLVRISIPLKNTISSDSYVIEFSNPSESQLMWIHIAEMKFSDLDTSGLSRITARALVMDSEKNTQSQYLDCL